MLTNARPRWYTILKLYKECYDHGIYNRGAGGDNPNVVASILRGIDPREL